MAFFLSKMQKKHLLSKFAFNLFIGNSQFIISLLNYHEIFNSQVSIENKSYRITFYTNEQTRTYLPSFDFLIIDTIHKDFKICPQTNSKAPNSMQNHSHLYGLSIDKQ